MNYTTKVYVNHYRLAWFFCPEQTPSLVRWNRKDKDNYLTPLTKGGKTEVTIQVFDEFGDPVTRFVGVATCSLKDNFCYKLGREIAMGRAMKQFEQWQNEFAIAHPEYKYIEVNNG